MFYGMNPIIPLVLVSFLIVGVIAVAVPKVVSANPSHQWCLDIAGNPCYETHKACKAATEGISNPPKCVKQPIV